MAIMFPIVSGSEEGTKAPNKLSENDKIFEFLVISVARIVMVLRKGYYIPTYFILRHQLWMTIYSVIHNECNMLRNFVCILSEKCKYAPRFYFIKIVKVQ